MVTITLYAKQKMNKLSKIPVAVCWVYEVGLPVHAV